MKIALIIFFMSRQSSDSGGTEVAATEGAFDTVQFYAAEGASWRIKTYAQDQDVHIWLLDPSVADIVALARANTEKHHGDLLTEGYVIETTEGLEGLRRELEKRGLPPTLDMPPSGAVFWAPAGSEYRSKSAPK